MTDAAWKPDHVEFLWGKDVEGEARGFSWCSLCGSDCAVGVVTVSVPRDPKGNAFFCAACVRGMVAAIPKANAPS